MRKRIALFLTTAALMMTVMLPGSPARAHSGEWQWVLECSLFCVYVPAWVPHDHKAESRREREKRCYEEYLAHRELCQLIHAGESREARRARAQCFAEATENLAKCQRGRG